MDAERLKQVEEIYHAAVDIPPGKRESFFKESCGTDENLRREVESLLICETTFDEFIDTPPDALAAEMFADRERQTRLINQEIGHYKIKTLLGEGGMGEVYLAEDTRLNRKVALKVLPAELTGNLDRLKRFEQEAQAVSALNHPNILTIHEFGVEDSSHFIAMEFVEGTTLGERMGCGRMPVTEILEVATQVASALSAAHETGIIHRDIKPDNIMIRRDGIVKVLDFGIAKLTEKNKDTHTSDSEAKTRAFVSTNPGAVIGTANYMSPEQARGLKVDARTDIFSFGIVLYEMLAGRQPFAGENAMDVISSILRDEPKPISQSLPEFPREIERIINKTLRKDCDERYQTAKDLLLDLKDVRQELEFQKKLGITSPDDGVLKSSDGHETQRARNAKTLIFAAPTTARSMPPEGGEDIHTTSSAEYIAGEVKKHKLGLLGGLGTLVIALAAIGHLTYFRAKPIDSIAVLPFVNVGDDRSNEYLSDGLSENLINTLARLSQLKVIARSSSFKYRGENIDIQDAAQKLGVGAILTGRVVRRGDDLQISVELINTADATRIWGDIYNRQVSGAINLPEEIAQAVSEKLHINLSGEQQRQMAKQITDNPKAYQLHLNGVFFRRKNGAENIRKAIEYQNQAIALDANFTRAYVELSINYGNLIDIGAMSPQEGLPLARSTVEKALALDNALADVHYNIGRIRRYEFEWAKAETAFKRSIELNPNLAAAHTLYAEYLSNLGRFDEAVREIKLAQELDPLRTGLVGNEGNIYYFARRYDEAIEKHQIHVDSAAENPFAHLWLANALAQKGQTEKALAAYQNSIKAEETVRGLIYLGRFHAFNGNPKEAAAILEKLNRSEKYVSPTELAILHAALGDKEKAFASLEKAYAERDIQLTHLKVQPGYDALRDDARFQDLLRRMNFN